MKKVILLIFAIGLFTSCVTPQLSEPYGFSSFLDYSPLTEKGIYVTESNSVSFDYKTIGSISVTEVHGWVKKGKEKKKSKKTVYGRDDDMYVRQERNQNAGKNVYVAPSLEVAMDRMANTLNEVGANGIINLKVRSEADRIIISGMAIHK